MIRLNNWITLEENISKAEIDEFIRTQMLISISYQTNRATYCTFCDDILQRHKYKEQLRKCKELKCPVKYKKTFQY
ncbi:hypothetical protein BpHYR1_020069 [Brachionus plicatilis]|uniref:Uncharacterized protein n=1 Tax=Brachionus plicatilis TaxID=10195 RepID=A0A3M7QXJ0_BRAPC|nr:hypothetical protein BpHYR1_020069 [Brachionus plicatilis]